MKLTDKISWLMGRVQRSLFPHLNQCLATPLTEQEERLVSILEILQVERHVPKNFTRYQYPGRKPHDRQSLARAFVAKALYRFPTTSDLRRALQSAANLRRICGFREYGDLPSEATFSRAFAEFAAGSLGCSVHDALVNEYLQGQLIGHISRDSTAIIQKRGQIYIMFQKKVNIVLVNELSLIFNRLGIDTHEVLEAAGTKWNFLPFRPGLVGGHCIGVDPYYLVFIRPRKLAITRK
jgi:hypothetical protein